jgi:hypothetical protein
MAMFHAPITKTVGKRTEYKPKPDQPVAATTSPVAMARQRVLLVMIPTFGFFGSLSGKPTVILLHSTTPPDPNSRKNNKANIAVLFSAP